jgi:hypothetical protein
MHTITINKLLPTPVDRLLIAAASLEMNIKLPNKVRLVIPGIDRIYDVTSYDISGVKEAPTSN